MEALDAAAAQDDDRLARGLDRLGAHHPDQVRRLLAACLRPALERRHADGVDGDDLAQLAGEVIDAHPGRLVDPFALVVVLTGAFGITVSHPDTDAGRRAGNGGANGADPQSWVDPADPVQRDEQAEAVARLDPATLIRHAVLITAHLATQRRVVRMLLDAAWSEIARADVEDG